MSVSDSVPVANRNIGLSMELNNADRFMFARQTMPCSVPHPKDLPFPSTACQHCIELY